MIDYDKPADFSASSMDDLQAAFVQSGADLVTISNRRDLLLATLDQRKAQAMAKAKVDALSPREFDALKAALDDTTPAAAIVDPQTINP